MTDTPKQHLRMEHVVSLHYSEELTPLLCRFGDNLMAGKLVGHRGSSGMVYMPHASVTLKGIVNKASNGYSCFGLVVDARRRVAVAMVVERAGLAAGSEQGDDSESVEDPDDSVHDGFKRANLVFYCASGIPSYLEAVLEGGLVGFGEGGVEACSGYLKSGGGGDRNPDILAGVQGI